MGGKVSPEQHALNRQAAKLRKQRGHGSIRKQEVHAPSLFDIQLEKRQHNHRAHEIQTAIDDAVANAVEQINQRGGFSINRSTVGINKKVILALKAKFRGTSVQWSDDGEQCSFGIKRKVA